MVIPYHQNPGARPWYRRLMTFTCTTTLNLLLGNRIKYYQGPNAYPTALVRVLPRKGVGGFFFLAEMTAHALHFGYSTVHVGLVHQEREHGTSKALSLRNILHAFRTIIRLWWTLSVRGASVTLPAGVPPPTPARTNGEAGRGAGTRRMVGEVTV